MTISSKRRGLFAATLFAAAFAAIPGQAQNLVRVTIAIPAVSFAFTADYVAEDAHLYEASGLDAKVQFLAGNAGFNALISGAVDFSFSSGTNLDRAAARGQKMLAIANMNNLPPWDVVVRRDIAEAAHFDPSAPLAGRAKLLKGRTLVIDGVNSAAHSYLRVIAQAAGIDPDTITVSALQPQEMLAAYQRHQIDGISLGPPWPQTIEQQDGAVAIASGIKGDPEWLSPIASSTLITRPQFCAEHRSACEKMGHAMVLASRFVHEHPDDALAILKKAVPQDRRSGGRGVLRRDAQGDAAAAGCRGEGARQCGPDQCRGRFHHAGGSAQRVRRSLHQRIPEIGRTGCA